MAVTSGAILMLPDDVVYNSEHHEWIEPKEVSADYCQIARYGCKIGTEQVIAFHKYRLIMITDCRINQWEFYSGYRDGNWGVKETKRTTKHVGRVKFNQGRQAMIEKARYEFDQLKLSYLLYGE